MKKDPSFIIIKIKEFKMNESLQILGAIAFFISLGYVANTVSEKGYWAFIHWKNKRKK